MPIIHLIIPPIPSNTRQRSACGVKKGAGMELIDFKKEMKKKISLLSLCEKCKQSQFFKSTLPLTKPSKSKK